MRNRAGIVVAVCVTVAVLMLSACFGGSKAYPQACSATDVHGSSYNRCKLMAQDQAYVEATMGQKFEIRTSSQLNIGINIGIKELLVCHAPDTDEFGILTTPGNDRPSGMWTLGRIDDEPFRYVELIAEEWIIDSKAKADELNGKLEEKYDHPIRNSCDDRRVVIGHKEKSDLLELNG